MSKSIDINNMAFINIISAMKKCFKKNQNSFLFQILIWVPVVQSSQCGKWSRVLSVNTFIPYHVLERNIPNGHHSILISPILVYFLCYCNMNSLYNTEHWEDWHLGVNSFIFTTTTFLRAYLASVSCPLILTHIFQPPPWLTW